MKNENRIALKKDLCAGCTACAAICPKNAISMIEDEEGFLYPQIENEKCINCGACRKVCVFEKNNTQKNVRSLEVYAVQHKQSDVRAASRSGGIFTAVSDTVLKSGGVVYGAVLNEAFEVIHSRAVTKEQRDHMRGSKYVQSDMRGVIPSVKKDLTEGRMVLFTGTSCQVMAVKMVIPASMQKNLILLDIICHGVPSPKIWKDYYKMLCEKHGEDIIRFDFRNKSKFGWKAHKETAYLSGREVDEVAYTNIFYNHLSIRPSCFSCPFKTLERCSDITIADCWGIEKAAKRFDDNRGTSLVLLNSQKGMGLFADASDEIDYEKIRIEDCMQPPLQGNYIKPSRRAKFWRDYQASGIQYIADVYGARRLGETGVDRFNRCKLKIRKIIKNRRRK